VAPNANISVPPATPKPQKSSESTFSFYPYFLDLMQQHAAELAAQGAALAAQRAALDRTIQDKDRLLREERAKRKADDESNKLMLQLQYKKDKQTQQDAGVLRKQLADGSAELARLTSQLHDVEAMNTQHVLLEKAKDEKSRASAGKMSHEENSEVERRRDLLATLNPTDPDCYCHRKISVPPAMKSKSVTSPTNKFSRCPQIRATAIKLSNKPCFQFSHCSYIGILCCQIRASGT
jgi:hypothetical protein